MHAGTQADVDRLWLQDDTHFDIALAAIEAGMHVLVTKPAVKTLEHHRLLDEAARRNNVLVGRVVWSACLRCTVVTCRWRPGHGGGA